MPEFYDRDTFSGRMPEFYHRYVVPVVSEPFAQEVALRLRGITGPILETAAGTGVVTRALVRQQPISVEITATDLNPTMVRYARILPGMTRVTWQEADAMDLPFRDASFSCVVCQFGVTFFADKQAAFRETFRVLRPHGRFLCLVWVEQPDSLGALAASVVGSRLGLSDSLMVPEYHDVATITADLSAAGFKGIVIEKIEKRCRLSSAHDAAVALCHGGLLRRHIDQQAPTRLEEITNAVTEAITQQFGTDAIDTPMHALSFTCVR